MPSGWKGVERKVGEVKLHHRDMQTRLMDLLATVYHGDKKTMRWRVLLVFLDYKGNGSVSIEDEV
jgi:hypothetical protein